MNTEHAKIIEEILETKVRPTLLSHGGNVELVDIKNDRAYVKMTGHCSGCPSAIYTLESVVKEEVLNNTKVVKDVKLHQEVSDELIAFAKTLMNKR